MRRTIIWSSTRCPGELVICSGIPLADRLVKKGVAALDPRGKEFDAQNMGERLAVRNLFTDLQRAGRSAAARRRSASARNRRLRNALDRILTRLDPQTPESSKGPL